MTKRNKKGYKKLVQLKYLILIFQIGVLLLSPVLDIGIVEVLIGLSVLAMSYSSQKQYGPTKLIWVYILMGIILIFLGIADLNGYHYL